MNDVYIFIRKERERERDSMRERDTLYPEASLVTWVVSVRPSSSSFPWRSLHEHQFGRASPERGVRYLPPNDH